MEILTALMIRLMLMVAFPVSSCRASRIKSGQAT
jgi:hypothetical protein